jgi:hypothetical protein
MQEYITHRQTVTNDSLDRICDQFTNCGWTEIDIEGTPNHIEAVIFEWRHSGIPSYPSLSGI